MSAVLPGADETRPAPELCAVPAAAKPQEEGTRRMVARLATLACETKPFANPFATGKTVEALKAQLQAAADLDEVLRLKPALGEMLLNDGRTEAAIAEFEDYERLLRENHRVASAADDARFMLMQAIAWLRLGEQENCLLNHNADSCLLPIRGGGVHQLQRGSRKAVELLTRRLERYPKLLDAAWLLNIAYMTLGEYPDRMPRQWGLNPRIFESEHDITRFPDVAGALGLDVDGLAGGVVMDDFDRDGSLDLLVSSSALDGPLRFFRNRGDGTFADCSAAAGLEGLTGGLNLVQGDYDNDGFVDVFILRGAWMGPEGRFPNSLLRNNGDGTFTDVTEAAGLLSYHPTQTAVWWDYNGDGWLDLFVGNESPDDRADACELFRNNGNGTFTECAAQQGIAMAAFVKAVVSADYNGDGRPDLYLSVRGSDNLLLRNDGPAGPDHSPGAPWHFTNVAAAAGVAEPRNSFSCAFLDYDNDGWTDLLVTGYYIHSNADIALDYLGRPHTGERARLYRNRGDGTFADVTQAVGLFRVIHAMGFNFGDLDNDGWLDFYAGTGDPFLGTLIPNRMFRNEAGQRFQEVTTSGGFGQLQKGHGIAFGDLNGDGAQDIYSVVGGAYPGDNYHNQLFANPGHGNDWIKLQLEGVTSNRSAIGASITVFVPTAAGERRIHRTVGSGASFGASPLRQEIGLGRASAITRVEITWPTTGRTQRIAGLQPGHSYAIREGEATARETTSAAFPWPVGASGPAHHHVAALSQNK